MFLINKVNMMDTISLLEQAAEEKYGIPIVNVSHWDSSLAFQEKMKQVLSLPRSALPWNYCYSYSLSDQIRQKVLTNLGVSSKQLSNTMVLLLQSSTIAIINIVNLLVQCKKKKLCILQPSYSSVAACCAAFSLNYDTEEINFQNGQPKIPIDKILNGKYDCVWITSPVYCTGCYFDTAFIEVILSLKKSGLTIITDESLAIPGKELLRILPLDPDVFTIYSPHKAIAINGLKFSAIVCDRCYEEFLEQWLDVFSGALSGSNRDAVLHYISPNYLNQCVPAYKAYIEARKSDVQKVAKRFPFASIPSNTDGHYINIFTDLQFNEPAELLKLLQDIIQEKMVSFFPGTLNGFSLAQGLNFRLNLTGDPRELPNALDKILAHLNQYYCGQSETEMD